MGIEGYDMNETCNLCGAPICLYYINYEEGLKMCSNEDCTYPFSGRRMEFYDVKEFQGELSTETPKYDAATVNANGFRHNAATANADRIRRDAATVNADRIGHKHSDFTASQNTSSAGETLDRGNRANMENLPKRNLEPVAYDEDEHLIKLMKRAHDARVKQPKRVGIIKDPKMLHQLKHVNEIKEMRSRRPQPVPHEIPKYEVNIDTNSEGGPIIKIDLTSYSQMQLTCMNDGASTSRQVFF